MAEESALMARLTRALGTTTRDRPLADRLILALVQTLDVDGGSISIGFAPADRTTLAVTDPLAAHLEELTDLLREGPALEAFRTRTPVTGDLQQQGVRWPLLAQALDERDLAPLLFAVPMRPDGDVVGVITLYRAGSRDREPLELAAAQFLAGAIGVAIVGRFERRESSELLWAERDRINQATGMVVAQLAISPKDALALLRAHAYGQGATLAATADLVVTRRLDFRTTDPSGDVP